jgi:phospholipid/cholesterol/gamma-HCH transport system substrate-binding protein
MKTKFSKEVIIGIVTILSLVLLYAGVNYLKGVNLFKPVNHYYVTLPDVKDLTISSPVYVDGFKVGLVHNIKYDYTTTNAITVEINLDKGMKINNGSYVTLEKTLLSGGELHIHLNKYVEEYLKSGSTIEGQIPHDMMSVVQDQIIPQIAELIPKLDSIFKGLEVLVNHPALSMSLNNIERTTAGLEKSANQLDRLLGKDVPEITSNLKTATANFAGFSEGLGSLDLNRTISTLNLTLANLTTTTDKLNSKDNSLGLLLNDTLLYKNLDRTLNSASELLIDLKQNPKKYVRFSVF